MYNKGYDLANLTLGQEAGDVATTVGLELSTQAKHTVLPTTQHDKSTILTNLPIYTAFFIFTHGSQATFGDCFATPASGAEHYLSANDVGGAVGQKSANQPPYNFVYLYACAVFANNDISMASSFGINPGVVDRACLGWPEPMAYGFVNNTWCENVWTRLCTNGDTLDQARAFANAMGQSFGGAGCWVAYFDHKVQPVIVGDLAMKVHGVYGGIGTQWYK